MMDAPRSVGPMIKILRDMGQYRYDPADVFRDWIDYSVGCFLVHGDREMAERMLAKYKADYVQLGNLLRAWMEVMDKEIADDGRSWFDALGTVYEYLASSSKRQWLGQFFTPPDVCDLMTQINTDPAQPMRGKRINDPAVGSGRTLLSFNAYHPGNYVCGEDLDPICAKMTVLNMAMHGCQGQVCCQDSLRTDDWRFGYEVNPLHATGGPPIPHLLPITKEQSVAWQVMQSLVREAADRKAEPKVVVPPPIEVKPKVGQLSLF
ncbi:N-6 DNA methylase [Persicitalea jodogahamensis]|nr:N-6 DNA methylase [Persicitalea jodogahamensis]